MFETPLFSSNQTRSNFLFVVSIKGIRQIFYFAHALRLAFTFIYYAMTTSFESLITRILLKRYSYPFALKLKHLYSYIYND